MEFKKFKKFKTLPIISLAIILAISSCRTDDYYILSEETEIDTHSDTTRAKGMYLLCQGNMGSNKCQLDYLAFSSDSGKAGTTAHYFSNIYAERNPDVVKELGDVGNDIKIYGSKLWIVVNCSNKVEVCRASDTRKLTQIDIPNCRYLAFHKGFAYVSTFVGPIKVAGDAPIGKVCKIDTLTMKIVDEVEVGYQPEEMAVIGDRLYVANSGGYRVPNYDRTVSEIDLNTFRELRKIDVAPNLYRCQSDKYGQLWVSSRGDYFGSAPAIHCLAPNSQGVLEPSAVIAGNSGGASSMQIVGDTLYYTGSDFNFTTMRNEQTIGMIDVRTRQQIETTLFRAPEIAKIERLYSIIVNPETKDFYLLDAKNYVSSGELLHFLPDGTFDYKVWTGDIPCAAEFFY